MRREEANSKEGERDVRIADIAEGARQAHASATRCSGAFALAAVSYVLLC